MSHKLQVSLVPLAMSQHRTSGFPSPPINDQSTTGRILQEILPCQGCGGFDCWSFCAGPGPVILIYDSEGHGMQHDHWQYRERSSGPSRTRQTRNQNHRNGLREAENPQSYQNVHDMSRTILEDGSVSFDLGNAWIEANNKSGSGKVWRTPSKNPSMVDHNLILAEAETLPQGSYPPGE